MKPDWKAFGQAVMEEWPEAGIDGFDLQELAEKHGIIKPLPGGFDPATCNDTLGVCPDAGDHWFITNY